MSESNLETVGGRGLPRAWEHDASFQDALYDWMQRAPWLAISALAHVMAILLLSIVPWGLLGQEPPKELVSRIEVPAEPEYQDDPIEPPPDVRPDVPDVPPDLPLDDPDVVDDPTPVDDAADDTKLGDPDLRADAPFDSMGQEKLLGIGGNAGGTYGSRFPGHGGRKGGGRPSEEAVGAGLKWLVDHQDRDGKWDCDAFMKHDPAGDVEDGAGQPEHDVGVTGLALLALLGDGHTTVTGRYKDAVARGVLWLRDQQDFESGLIGQPIGHSYLYDHAIATLALCEAYHFSGSPILRGSAQRAINFVTRARNPYGVWRYEAPPNGDNDTSVTGWMVFALKSAQESGLMVDSQAFDDALSWFDEVTDPATGRVGYDSPGSVSSRIVGVNDDYPTAGTEAMTAVGLLSRFFLGQAPDAEPLMTRHADLLVRNLPEWSDDGLTNDMYYWYYGTYAMYQMGGRHWRAWQRSMTKAVVESRRTDGAANGSWEPSGPWGFAGGRVYSTATMVLCLEVYYRYARVLGAR
ncbi:MAG: terpene cyclase/mutase family protein [Planctomycetes bacterium]|nr:terpene cyclase/mutase family protein [Planctomycetota bacterium]